MTTSVFTKLGAFASILAFSKTQRLAAVLIAFSISSFAAAPARSATLVVSNPAELAEALALAMPGTVVLAQAGTYLVPHPLVVKDGVTLLGEGSMQFADGLPTGFDPVGKTVLEAAPDLVGDLLTLGHESIVSALVLEDSAARTSGNVVMVSTRAPGDVVSATLLECEIINPMVPGIGPQGPIGRAVVAVTRNLNFGAPPPPHADSFISVTMSGCLVRTAQAHPLFLSGLWAHHFASRSSMEFTLTGNVLGGGMEFYGGNSRPDAVADSSIHVTSKRNLYRSDAGVPQAYGWFAGGATSPAFLGAPESASGNRVRIHSVNDRIIGFETAIYAVAGRRPNATAAPIFDNHVELSVHGIKLLSIVRDLWLAGAESAVAEPLGIDTNNTVRVLLSHATGSGVRANLYSHGSEHGAGNRVEVIGSPKSFVRSNKHLLPPPPAGFYTSSK
jgi:hypothetical protein